MKIEHYSFGNITIDGQTYTSDVIIFPDRVYSSWWRKEGHLLQVTDLKDVIKAKPEVLIVGTGAYGVMKVPEQTIEHLKSNGIEAYIENTKNAVELYNKIASKKSAIAALHLTC